MKTILVLTDYSANAAHAAAQAVKLAAKLGANLLIAHSYVLVPVSDYATVVPVMSNENLLLEEDNLDRLKALTQVLRSQADRLPESAHKPQIKYVQLPVEPGSMVKALCSEHNIELIVAGESKSSGSEHFFFGSNIRKILDHAGSPVLLIPEKTDLNKLGKVVFASDFGKDDFDSLNMLNRLAKAFRAEVVIGHVLTADADEKADRLTEEAFKKKLASRHDLSVTYHHLGGTEVAARLQSFCKTTHAGMLAIGHRQYHFLGRLVHKSTAKAVIGKQHLPLLIFPSTAKTS